MVAEITNPALLIALSVLVGPAPTPPTIPLRIHVGRNHESDVVRAELACRDDWFRSKREAIEVNYRLIVVDDLYSQRPYVEIGRGAARHELRRGSFCGSGTFILALESIAEMDRWERTTEDGWRVGQQGQQWRFSELIEQHLATRPVPFPPEPTIEGVSDVPP